MARFYTVLKLNLDEGTTTVLFESDAYKLQQDIPISDFLDWKLFINEVLNNFPKFDQDVADAEAKKKQSIAPEILNLIDQQVSVP